MLELAVCFLVFLFSTARFAVEMNVLRCHGLVLLIIAAIVHDSAFARKHLVDDPEDGPQPKEHERLKDQQQDRDGVVCGPGVVLATMEHPGVNDVSVQEMARVDPDDHEARKDGITDTVRHANVFEAFAERKHNIRQIHRHKDRGPKGRHIQRQREGDQQDRDQMMATGVGSEEEKEGRDREIGAEFVCVFPNNNQRLWGITD